MIPINQGGFRRRLIGVVTLPVVLLLLLAGISVWQTTQLLLALRWVDHTNRVIAEANRTQKLILDQETGLRGYLLTKNPDFLEPYQQADAMINTTLADLKQLVSDNSQQVQRLLQLESQYQEWRQLSHPILFSRPQEERESISTLLTRKQKMDSIRRQITAFIATETQLRDQRSQTAQHTTQRVILSSILLSIAIGLALAYFIWQELRQVSASYATALQTAQAQSSAAQRSAHRLAELHRIDRAILAAQSIESLVQETLAHLSHFAPTRQAAVTLLNPTTHQNEMLASTTTAASTSLTNLIESLKPTGNSVSSDSATQSKTFYLEDIRTLPEPAPALEVLSTQDYRSIFTVAMDVEGTQIGHLILIDQLPQAFHAEDQAIAQEIGAQLAIAIHQSRLRHQLQNYASELEQRVQERTTQLQSANEELRAFVYSVSHDLRAPLRTLQGFAQALLEDYSHQMDADAKEYIQFISDGAVQMDTLITDLLAYSQVSRTQMQLQPVDLNQAVTTALQQVSKSLQEQQAEVKVDQPLLTVMAYRPILVQAITNLLSNALKFTPESELPEIHIFAEEDIQAEQVWVRLWIEDNGIGIAPEHQERIFHVFERLHSSETYPGTGIGLAIVRKGLERMGGRTGVESRLGEGSQFWLALPKAVLPSSGSIDDSNHTSPAHTRRGRQSG